MSELRDRVAMAIYAVVNDEEHWASEAEWLRADYRSKADAAIAAMQVEPTEVEIEAVHGWLRRNSIEWDRPDDCDDAVTDLLTTLIAARNAGQNGDQA
jgi:hypothetical protein